MTDKIITTLETDLDWYDPKQMLPQDDEVVFIKLSGKDNFCLGISSISYEENKWGELYISVEWHTPYPEMKSITKTVDYWTYLPNLPEKW